MRFVLSVIAAFLMSSPMTASAFYRLTLSGPGSATTLIGDKNTSVVACVKDANTGTPYQGATFQGTAYVSSPYSYGATINGVNAVNTVATVSGISTGADGCATIPVSTFGIPMTGTPYWTGSEYLSLSTTNVSISPGNAVINFSVAQFAYTVSPTSVHTDGTYSLSVVVSDKVNGASGSNQFHDLYLSAYCPASYPNPALSFNNNPYNPPAVKIDATNTATFPITVTNSLFTNPNTASTTINCYFSEWVNDTSSNAGLAQFASTNTCAIGLSPGDPNCGPSN